MKLCPTGLILIACTRPVTTRRPRPLIAAI
jgi:hypothetical protein